MTKAEHTKAYRAARSATARQVIDGKRKIRREYLSIIAKIAQVIRGNRSKLFLEEQIRAAFPRKELFDRLMKLTLDGRADTARLVADIEKRYIFEALDKVPGHGLSKDKIAAMFEVKIERTKIANSKPYLDAVQNAKEKTYTGTGFAYRPEGKWKGARFDYTFRQSHSLSKSVWDTVNHTEETILNEVWGSLSQGRDIKTTAADLMAYARGGPQVLPGRWGKLEPGTREYVKRLGKQGIDYRAMRLYRSEKYRHLQEAAVEDGESSPACTGEYDWILMPGRETWNCDCPDIAAAGPYRADNIPEYRHPNCDCLVEPRMKGHDEFIQQLRDYANGEDTPGAHEIDEWARANDLAEDGFSGPGAWEDIGNTPPRKIEHTSDYSEYSPAIAAGIEGEYLRQYSQREKKEAMSIMKGVKVLGTWEGTQNRISIELDEDIMNIIKKSSPGDLRIIHTHINNTAFSLDDLTILRKYNTIRVLAVQGINGNYYTMSIPDGGSRVRRFLEFQYGLLRKELSKERLSLDKVGFHEELNRRIADKMRWRFTPSSKQGRTKNMAEENSDEMTMEEWDHWSRTELGGISQKPDDDDTYNIQVALEVAKVMGKDVEAFKKLSPQEQKERYDEYKKEMDALSDEELAERYEKYF